MCRGWSKRIAHPLVAARGPRKAGLAVLEFLGEGVSGTARERRNVEHWQFEVGMAQRR